MDNLAYDLEEMEVEEKEKFVVNDDSKADWCLEKLKEISLEIERKEKLAQERKDQIQAWLVKEKEKLVKSKEWFEGMVTSYFMDLKEKDSKLKTLSLPFGKIQARKQQPKWNYDDKVLIQFVKDSKLDALRVKEEVDKDKLKKLVKVVDGRGITEAGEIVEGVTIEEQPDKITVSV
jgi:hypothetical protein